MESINSCTGRSLLKSFLEAESAADKIVFFDKITELYMQFNAVINISALRNTDDIYIKHYLDSIVPYKYFHGTCCDVGCGGGFPCLPLAVVTDCEFLGIDGVGKKLGLINNCAERLGLKNISARHARAEQLKQEGLCFDTVCARAVADTDKILSYCAPLCKKNGKILLYKTQNDEKALKSTENKQHITLSEIKDYVLPGTDIKRRLFVYIKQ